jgi:hypothetical protein
MDLLQKQMKQNEEIFQRTFAEKTVPTTLSSSRQPTDTRAKTISDDPKGRDTDQRRDHRRSQREEEIGRGFEAKKPKVIQELSRSERPQRPFREQKSSVASKRRSEQVRPHTSQIRVDETLRRSLKKESPDNSNQWIAAVLDAGDLTDLSQLLDVIDPMTVQVPPSLSSSSLPNTFEHRSSRHQSAHVSLTPSLCFSLMESIPTSVSNSSTLSWLPLPCVPLMPSRPSLPTPSRTLRRVWIISPPSHRTEALLPRE